jgi:hypothetical protein
VKDFFHPILVEETKQRILRLRPESERQWGSMGVAQTLAISRHPAGPAYQALGLPRRQAYASQVAFVAGAVVGGSDTVRARARTIRVIAAIDCFASQGAACCTGHRHPFFGPLKPEQWAILMYKHVDHHVRQFGV